MADIPKPEVPLDALKKAIAVADKVAVHEWHGLVIDAGHEAYRAMRDAGTHSVQRYRQLMDLELAIIARGREVGLYPEPNPPRKRVR